MLFENFEELKDNGYTVVEGVITEKECEECIGQYAEWLSTFHDGKWPHSCKSLIHCHRVGHLEPTWRARLKARPVFSSLWGTDKLLTSFDGVAIGRPSESGDELFDDGVSHWLHLDQQAERVGLHGYQGAVYLEAADHDDWTLYVMKGSHRLHSEFFDWNEEARKRSNLLKFYPLSDDDVAWYASGGCTLKRLPVPKGGLVLWDSRLVHANARPMRERAHPGRWRYVVFVCMAPAIWAEQTDLEVKRKAYEELRMTTHWPSRGVGLFGEGPQTGFQKSGGLLTVLPQIARTLPARRLSGVEPYNFEDGRDSGPLWSPEWSSQGRGSSGLMSLQLQKSRFFSLALICGAVVLGLTLGWILQ